jgi:RNase P subunit RPR2
MMPSPIYFVQECPTCGRRLQIRVEFLGKRVVCQHCQGHLLAVDPANVRCDCPQSSQATLQRADELLESMTPRRPQPR